MRKKLRYRPSILIALLCLLATSSTSTPAEIGRGLSGRLLVGYQGWFGCPNDFEDNKLWQHWFVPEARPRHFNVDLLPSVRSLDTKDLCDTGLPRADGRGTIKVFSSQSPAIVHAHFHWMRTHGIDGAVAQRFISALRDSATKRRFDHVLDNVRNAAEASDRIFFVAYDVSGANPESVIEDIKEDWRYLSDVLHLTSSSAYLRDGGKPVVELWGFGFQDRPGTPEQVDGLINDLKLGKQGLAAATVIGGVPTHWRTLTEDSKRDSAWASTYRSYDVISPWSIGRFSSDLDDVDRFMKENAEPDIIEAHRSGVRYMPTAFPGFSWFNLMANRGQWSHAVLNRIPRKCGRFLWAQLSALVAAQADSIYVAMFDETDEGTAILPAVTHLDMLPKGSQMIYLNQDGCALPDDWYLRVTGRAAQFLHKRQVPPRELDAVIKP